ncbi:hypothetical protein RIF29_24137 [Crotalaria pallida]|uniref:Late embryogenesis abundant protein LEA-2 subgroup domain-containing protein n=1 Tax=Crotalaria pallida TaxID=3830 RepID=A0AAN9EJ82_CROPI
MAAALASSQTPTPPSGPSTKPILQKPPGYRSPFTEPPPPRKGALPPPLRPKKKRRRGCCCILCCTILIVILVLIFASVIAAGLVYIVYDPALPEFRVSSFGLSNLNVTQKRDGVFLNAETVARVEVKNKSGKMKWFFDTTRIDVTAEDEDLDLGSTQVPGFEMKEKGRKELKAVTAVKDIALDEGMRRKVIGKELVPIVELRTKTGVGMQGWKSWKIGLTVVRGFKSSIYVYKKNSEL